LKQRIRLALEGVNIQKMKRRKEIKMGHILKERLGRRWENFKGKGY